MGFSCRGCTAKTQVHLLLRRSLTVSHFRPLARRRASSLRPFFVAMRERNPCVLERFRRLGWYVRLLIRLAISKIVYDYLEIQRTRRLQVFSSGPNRSPRPKVKD